MAKSENLKDESQDQLRLKIVKEEVERFKKLVQGHKKLLVAIGNL